MNELTVLMPVYNGEKYLREAIECVLNQTYTDFDFLIIDDGSTDSSIEIIRSYQDNRIRLIVHEQNQKLISTLNEGLAIAQTPYVARIDCDDVASLDRLDKQMTYLRQYPDTVVVGSDFHIIDGDSKIINTIGTPSSDAMIRWYAATNNPFAHGSVIMNREVALAVGGYNRDAYLTEDFDLWLRMMEKGKMANVPEPLYLWRQLGTSESGSKGDQMNAASQSIQDKYWESFNKNEPFKIGKSMSDEYIDELKTCEGKDYRKRYVVRMHTHFADGFARRKNYVQKIRHVMAAIRIEKSIFRKSVLFLSIVLPSGWIARIKKNPFLYQTAKKFK